MVSCVFARVSGFDALGLSDYLGLVYLFWLLRVFEFVLWFAVIVVSGLSVFVLL